MTATKEIMNAHATNLRDEHQDARLAIPPRIRAIADLINKDKILEEEGDARYMVCADIAGACETVCTDALTEREAMSLLYDLGEKLNNPDARAVIIGDSLIPVGNILHVYVDNYWPGDEEEGD